MSERNVKVLMDTNVALDLLLAREPFLADALHMFALGEAGRVDLLMSSDAMSTVFYIVDKNAGAAAARESVSKISGIAKLMPVDERAVLRALSLDFEDFEDALVCAVAENSGADVIVTRNESDFEASTVLVMNPATFLSAWKAREVPGAD